MNIAVIDIGANTIRLNIYVYENDKLDLLFNKKHVAGLASYTNYGSLSEKGIKKLCRILESNMRILNAVKHDRVYVFATASLRNINNTAEVVRRVNEKTGMEIELISQQDEAKFGFEGILMSTFAKSGITVDIGGGSTEIISFKNKKISGMYNLGEGSLSLHNSYVKGIIPNAGEIRNIQKVIKRELKSGGKPIRAGTIIGIGGTIRAAGNIIQEMYDLDENTHFTFDHLVRLCEKLEDNDRNAIRVLLKVKPDRVHTIVPGITILYMLCKKFDVKEIFVSETGLREGLVMEKIKAEEIS